ncbi:MAG: IS982 family transposase, partial [Thermomicrobiales bacterium]
MDLDDFIVTTSCLIDETIPLILAGRRLRQRGPQPLLADSEVLTMEVVGEFLGYDQDQAIYQYFQRHYAHFFPGLRQIHRTTFVRQAANLWKLKELRWKRLVAEDWEPVSLVDSFPIPVCAFPRARWCRRFAGEANYGREHVARQTFDGFRLHVR